MQPSATVHVKIWDPWVRLVHWAIVGLIGLSWWSAETGRMDLHLTSGYLMLTLLLFRLLWGFIGSETARFRHFLRSPLAALGHLRHLLRRTPDTELGHNAAGGWMVLVLLGVLLLQVGTGLFADDQILTRGPLASLVSGAASGWMTFLHIRNFNVILGLAALHVVAVAIYALVKGHNLVLPMLTGAKRVPAGHARHAPRLASPLLALVLLIAAGAAVWGLSRLG